MSRALMTLLGRPKDKLLEIAFSDLEKATGHCAIDARLVGDILHRAHACIRDMGLEGDVTARELYQALRVHGDMLDDSTAFVGLVIGDEVVSFNHDDVQTDAVESRQFEQRSRVKLSISLAKEIERRYRERATHPALLVPIIQQLFQQQEVER